MNYNNHTGAGAKRGKPRRPLDPSAAGFTSPSPTPSSNPYMYNQQMPMDANGMLPPDYGFTVPGEQQNQVNPNLGSPYGFAQQPAQSYASPATSTPYHGYSQQPQMTPFTPTSNMRNDGGFPGTPLAAQFLAEPVANMAMQYGNTLANTGKQHLEKYVPVTALRYYFAVDTDYVMMKLILLFFPFTHKDWSIKYEQDSPLQPRYEKNAPDMYIPTMAFLTYVVMAGLSLGTQEKFTPEQLGITASSALAWGLLELFIHMITLYVMSLDTSLMWLDLLAYCSYKYVGINAALLASILFKRLGYYCVLVYYSMSLAFFLIRSLKLRVIPEGHYSAIGNKRRLYFILFVAGIQPILMWWLSYHLV